ncbi:hypothetical protein DS909_16815 [Phaeobacter gallaeciensis]|uniref:Uncharacterized protein n=2 Tax=Roseobacteraceae TaxID=2854170 RepID=A0A366WXW9_9RHOB|nr:MULTISPECIES: hypothetical protein [Roseobacteraceae]MBT3140949.1 hypothetical protein [Falsiruegeria litorea]MBT8170693.1 hypothetical protein [Falsiruegeria litorea]RBW52972.1 hypothetical protein DS909_16815 [Phaeobacter gallaeciensis]
MQASRQPFNIVVVGQNNRLQFEAVLFAASLRHCSPNFNGQLFVASPQPGPKWDTDPSLRNQDVLQALNELGAEVLPFQNRVFGQSYPYGNKIEALQALPKGEPFVFFDTDTLITGDIMSVPFDFNRPSASLRREGTWPQPTLYGPGYTEIWKALYDRFGLNFRTSLDLGHPDEYWERYLYFNAGYFYGACPRAFGQRFLTYAKSIRQDLPIELVCQSLDPWLDQVALPLVIHSFGGGRDTLPSGYLDGEVSCHYRHFPLLYARESDHVVEVLETVSAPNKVKKVLKQYDPIKRTVFQGRGAKARALFDRDHLPRKEQAIRNRIKSEGLWMR